MGIPVLILGESGTGKSASMRNFKAEDLKVINVANKPLPFKNKFESIPTDEYKVIIKELKLSKKKITVIDDAQYLMANEFMRRATEKGYDKFTEIAQNFWTLVNCVKDLPEDHIVYFMAHIERDANGNEKIKTIGKMLDEKITVEGMFTIVLKTNVTDGKYSFLTQNSGHDTVKSPIGMFPTYAIDNDLKYVDDKIRNYYEIGEFLSDDDLKAIDEAVKHEDIPIKEEKPKRGRRSAKKEESKETSEKEETEKPEETKRSRNSRTETGDNNDSEYKSDSGVSNETVSTSECSSDDDGTRRRSRRRSSETMDEEPEETTVGEPDNAEVPKSRVRTRKSREEVQAENGEKVANAGIPEGDDREEVPFEETETPELEKLPRRTRRRR